MVWTVTERLPYHSCFSTLEHRRLGPFNEICHLCPGWHSYLPRRPSPPPSSLWPQHRHHHPQKRQTPTAFTCLALRQNLVPAASPRSDWGASCGSSLHLVALIASRASSFLAWNWNGGMLEDSSCSGTGVWDSRSLFGPRDSLIAASHFTRFLCFYLFCLLNQLIYQQTCMDFDMFWPFIGLIFNFIYLLRCHFKQRKHSFFGCSRANRARKYFFIGFILYLYCNYVTWELIYHFYELILISKT